VNGEAVVIPADSSSRAYLSLAQATRADALPPEPVPGRVAFDESRAASIFAPLPGRVDSVAVRLGQRVAQGDRLVAIRSAQFVDLLHEIDSLRASEAVRRKTVERLSSLVRLKASAEKDLMSAELELSEARLAREAAELRLRARPIEASGDGTAYWLTSPRSGVIVERQVLAGDEVSPERSNPLLIVAEIDEVIVTADVTERDVSAVQVGDPADVRSSAEPDRSIPGRVEHVSEVIDPVRRMVTVRIRVPNPDRLLRPNAFVQVGFRPPPATPVVVEAEAVVTDDQRSFVFVVDPDHPERFERRAVVPGRQRAGKVELLSGLEPGETYVVRGAILLLNAVDLAL
jgi:cobalt-zinc-cadmium efflux system membrane fusion protein